jgi:hypothetical protein
VTLIRIKVSQLVLLVQLGSEAQIGSGEVGRDPLVNPRIQFWTEVILPVACFA